MNEMTKQIQQIMYPKAALIAYECETADFSRPQNYLELGPSMKEDGWEREFP